MPVRPTCAAAATTVAAVISLGSNMGTSSNLTLAVRDYVLRIGADAGT